MILNYLLIFNASQTNSSIYSSSFPILGLQVFGFAATYLKRFYLNNSVMDYSPREMMLTALYLAFKAADYPISLNRFVDHIPRNRERYHAFISRSELFLMDKLLYDLWIYPPYRPLVGFLVELIAFRQSKDSSMTDEVATELMNSLRKEGYEIINTWFQTDLCFTNPPSQYALAVVMELGRRHPELQTADFVSTVVLGDVTAEDGDEESVEQKKERLWDKLEAIQTMISEFDFIVDLSVGLELENVLAECRNPLYDIDSDDYKEIQRQAMERILEELIIHGLKALKGCLPAEVELSGKNCALAIVGKEKNFTICPEEEVSPYLAQVAEAQPVETDDADPTEADGPQPMEQE
nr:cyclin [Hymenolepis microstoma]